MDNAIYAALARQSGLMREMAVVANNVANAATAGFRREGVIFAEHVKRLDGAPSLSIARASARNVDLTEGPAERTGGTFDIAIAGSGFFLVETPAGQRLTRSGQFLPDAEGTLMTPDGHALLDAGGAPVIVPPGAADITVSADGTLSTAGLPFGQIGLWRPVDPTTLRHTAGTLFEAAEVEPAEDGGSFLQGHLEGSNVNPVAEIARMIEVSRIYEAGQRLIDREDERIRAVIQTLGK